MLLPVTFLLIDFVSYALFEQWLMYSVLMYLISIAVMPGKMCSKSLLYGVLALVLIHDFAVYGRFGLILAFLVPMILITFAIKDMLLSARFGLMGIWIISFILFDDLFIKMIVFSGPIVPSVTIMKILFNLIIGYGIYRGKRGNRSLIV